MMGAALGLRMLLLPVMPTGLPFTMFYPAIIASAVLFGIRAGVLAGVIGVLLAWYFFLPGVGFALGVGVPFALVLYTAVIAVSLTLIRFLQLAIQRANDAREVSRKLAESRETLFRELQHRVGNNLQVVSALLSLQKRKLTDPAAIEALEEAADRVQLIGEIQRQLYDPSGEPQALTELLARVIEDCLESYGRADVSHRIEVEHALCLRPELAIPTSLIVFEAVSNAIEHGFADCGGTVSVSACREGESVVVAICDDGAGLPSGFALMQDKNLGLKLARAMAGQCGGSFSLARVGDLTQAEVRFPFSAG